MIVFLFLKYHELNSKLIDLRNDVIEHEIKLPSDIQESAEYDYSESLRKPMNVDFHFLQNDKRVCTEEGQIVKIIGTEQDYTCTEDDILKHQFSHVLVFDKMKTFIRKLIKTDRFFGLRKIYDDEAFDIKVPYNLTESDLFITVTTRPCINSAAYATRLMMDPINYRPTQGLINICPSVFLKEGFSSTDQNSLFHVIFHEFVHVLGLSNSYYAKWLNRETGKSWGSDFPLSKYEDPRFPNRSFYILHTPQCHNYAKKRWNSSEFAPGIPMGIEIENGGGSGTKYSHPEGRISNGEVMSGQVQGYSVISDMVLSIIEDMGWYSVDFSLAKPLRWGDFRSFGELQPKNLHREPMMSFLPPHYYCSKKDIENIVSCDYDYKSMTVCVTVPVSCPSIDEEDQDFCSSEKFYNPLNLSYRGDLYHDYIPVKASAYRVEDASCFVAKAKTEDALNALFGHVECSNDNSYYEVFFYGRTYLCNYEGKNISVDDNNLVTSFICTSPKILCEGIEYDKQIIPQPERVPFPLDRLQPTPQITPHLTEQPTPLSSPQSDSQNDSKLNQKKNPILYILIGSGILVVFLVVIVFTQIKKRKNTDQSSSFHQF